MAHIRYLLVVHEHLFSDNSERVTIGIRAFGPGERRKSEGPGTPVSDVLFEETELLEAVREHLQRLSAEVRERCEAPN